MMVEHLFLIRISWLIGGFRFTGLQMVLKRPDNFLLLGPLAVYRTVRATQGEMYRDVHFSFDKQGRASKRP